METQFVSINFISYNTVLLEYIRFFRIRPPKKRSKKEQGSFSGTFINEKKFCKSHFFMKKTRILRKNKIMLGLCFIRKKIKINI